METTQPKTSFWANPENNSLKVILLVAVIAVAGFFVYRYMQTGSLGGKGQVVDTSMEAGANTTSPTTAFTFKTEFTGATCTLTVCSKDNADQCIPLTGKSAQGQSCRLDDVQFAPGAQGLHAIITAKPVKQGN